MRKLLGVGVLLAAAGVLFLCGPPGAAQNNEAELWRHRNLGKALYEMPTSVTEAPAELKKALELAPDSVRDRLNYGLSLLRAGEPEAGIAELQKVQKQDPALPHTWFNLGIAYKHDGRYPEAIRQFQGMLKLVPDEPAAHYNLGLLYNLTDRPNDAIQEFRTAAKLDPRMVAPLFQIYNYHRLHGEQAEATKALAAFQAAKERQQANSESEDVEWCVYAELYDPIQARPAGRTTGAAAKLQFEDHKLAGTLDPATAGLLVVDANGDGNPDLLAWSKTGMLLYHNARDAVANSGLGGVQGVVSVAAGDFDNDGLADLCVVTEAGPRLFHNAKGHFEESSAKLASGSYRAAVWLDFDHDYDEDLFLLGAKSVLMRNRGDGTFEDYTAHFPFVSGEALNGVAFRVVPDTKGTDLAVAYANRVGVLYRDQLRGVFEAAPLDAVPAGARGLRAIDIDNDSWNDLAFTAGDAVTLARNHDGKFEREATGGTGAFVFADLEDRGFADLAAANGVLRNDGLAHFAKPVAPGGLPAGTAWAAAGFLAAVAPDGSIHVLANRTATKNEWIRAALTGVKNLKLAPGTEVEVKAGDLYRKRIYRGVPLRFGLGPYKQVDTIRISWANGLIQNEPNKPAGNTVTVKEAPRLSGSCPMIFTWNGKGFEFISDVLGVAPLGASSGDGNYFPVDHDEYVQIPGDALAPKEGAYEVRVTEELHEVSYLDQVQLIAVDHPRAVEVFTNDKFKSPPFPEFRLFGVRQRIYPAAARDDGGRDVLPELLRRDGVYAAGFRHDYAGVADRHTLTLDFGPRAARDNRAVLLLEGWVDWADGSTFLGASQTRGGGLVFPYLQVKDAAGKWQTVVEDMGIPSGKPKTIAVDLSGKFLSASREVRIVTNLCVYWDEIFLSDAAPPPVRLTRLDAQSAALRLRGFSRTVIHPRREQPEVFEYAKWTPYTMWNQTAGRYTRYGDVRELVTAVDDKLAILGSGDELRLFFPAGGLAALPGGWRRDFLLLVDGWAKDSDANTAYSQTVEPLPFHGMSRYPYPAGEHFPDDAAHREYRKNYNTRPAIRFIEPLVAGTR